MPRELAGHVDGMADASTNGRSSKRSTSSDSPRRGQDAVALLREEHRAVEQEFKKFEGLGPNAVNTRQKIVDGIVEQLSKHAEIEELVFYPIVRDRISELDGDVLEALEEHHLVKLTLSELGRTPSDHERYVPKVQVLIENVRHHVDEEETQLFPRVREAFTRTELEEIGAKLADARTTAASRPHPHAPDPLPATSPQVCSRRRSTR